MVHQETILARRKDKNSGKQQSLPVAHTGRRPDGPQGGQHKGRDGHSK